MSQPIDITVILDRSGSMLPVRNATIRGFNKFIREQDKDAKVSLWQFDSPGSSPEISATFKDRATRRATLKPTDYEPRGMTPLLDAVGTVVSDIKAKGKHIVVVITDGMENASREWTRKRVHDLVTKRRKRGWEFVFMGADIDAYGESGSLGMSPTSTYAYANNAGSTQVAWDNLSVGTRSYSTGMTSSIVMPDEDTADPTYTPPTS